jgi:hypothetical protein
MKHLYAYVLMATALTLGNITAADQKIAPKEMTKEYCQAVFDRCKEIMPKSDKNSVELGLTHMETTEGFTDLYNEYLAKYDKNQQTN